MFARGREAWTIIPENHKVKWLTAASSENRFWLGVGHASHAFPPAVTGSPALFDRGRRSAKRLCAGCRRSNRLRTGRSAQQQRGAKPVRSTGARSRKALRSRATRCRPPPSQSRCIGRRFAKRRATSVRRLRNTFTGSRPRANSIDGRRRPGGLAREDVRRRDAERDRPLPRRVERERPIRYSEAERRRHEINHERPLPRVDRNVVASRYDSRLRELEREVRALRADREVAMRRTADRRPPPRELRRDERERYAVSQRAPRRAARDRYSDEN